VEAIRLKRLELHGFKTFATRAALEFAPGITAVVGPNGSGKSNVADAVRWVLGEQSLRLLRARRLEDVVFGGGAGRAPVGLAEVQLTLDNSEGVLPPGFAEVVVGRRAFRSGESEYLLNRSRVRLRDVADLLSRAGVGQNGHSVIGQGMVDQALSLRPEERRGLFEDAAGLRRFHAKRDEAEARLAEARLNATRVADLIAELEPRVQQLQRQARRAQEELRLRAECQEAMIAWLAHQRWEIERGLDQWRPEQEALTAAWLAGQTTVRAADEAIAQARARIEGTREREALLTAREAELQRVAESARQNVVVQQERRKAAARLAGEAAAQVEQARQRLAAIRRDGPQAAAAVKDAGANLAAAQAAAQETHQQFQVGAQSAAGTHAALRAARQAAADAGSRFTQVVTRYREAEQQRAHLRKQVAEANAGRDRTAADARTATTRLAALEEAARERTTELAATEAKRKSAADACAELEGQLTGLDATVLGLEREAGALQARLEVFRQVTSAAGTAGRHGGAATAGGCDVSTLGGLLAVPAELDAAAAAAGGAALGWLVPESQAEARQLATERWRACGERATFIGRDLLAAAGDEARRTIEAARLTAPDGVETLAERVVGQTGDPYLAWAAFGDTLLVDTFEDGLALADSLRARDRPAIATMAGERIDPGGAITAGAPPDEAQTLRRLRELRETEARLQAVREQLAPHKGRRAEIEAVRASAQQAVERLDVEVRTIQQRESQEEGERRSLAQQQARLSRDLSWWSGFAERAAAQLADVELRSATLAERRGAAEVAQRQARERLDGLIAQVQGHEEQLTRLRDELGAARTASAVAEQALGQAIQRAALADATASAVRADMAAAERRLRDAAGEQALLEEASERAASELLEREQSLLSVVQELANVRRELDDAGRELERQRGLAGGAQAIVAQAERDLALLEAKQATRTERLRALEAQAMREVGELPAAKDAGADAEQLDRRLARLQERLRTLGPVNQIALQEHAEAAERLTFMRAQLQDLSRAEAALERARIDLEAGLRRDFGETFQAVAEHFRTYFRRLFGGGEAGLVLTEPGDLAETGVDIVVQLPGKRRQQLAMLSGGERALVAAALLFALLKARPSPFCVMDEVDAALDEANVGRFCDVLQELSEQTQFVVITHNRTTMEQADALYGVTLGDDGVSHVVSIRLPEAVALGSGAALNGAARNGHAGPKAASDVGGRAAVGGPVA
jgi:chromosome segregation protein